MSQICQSMLSILPNNKKTDRNLQNTYELLPKWRYFAKSGHSVYKSRYGSFFIVISLRASTTRFSLLLIGHSFFEVGGMLNKIWSIKKYSRPKKFIFVKLSENNILKSLHLVSESTSALTFLQRRSRKGLNLALLIAGNMSGPPPCKESQPLCLLSHGLRHLCRNPFCLLLPHRFSPKKR